MHDVYQSNIKLLNGTRYECVSFMSQYDRSGVVQLTVYSFW
jgi:hypothetical protein